MVKRVVLGLVGILLIGGVVFVYFELQQKTVISNELSGRSKEFLSRQERGSNDPLRYANVNEKAVASGEKTLSIDECLKITVPFPVKFVRRDGECDYTIGISKPRGSIVVYQRSESITSIDQVPGIGMRRESSHAYKESSVMSSIGKFVIFEKGVDGYEKNAFYFDGAGTYIVVNLLVSNGKDSSKAFEEMLSSVVRSQ